uniref:acetolactate decarboxylase n=1 Tax=Bacillus subtilis TaxID=1423 RepID=UPI001642F7DA
HFQKQTNTILPTTNLFYPIPIHPFFKNLHTTTLQLQQKPYLPILQPVKTHPIFNFHNVTPTILPFFTPPYPNPIPLSPYHLHFIH